MHFNSHSLETALNLINKKRVELAVILAILGTVSVVAAKDILLSQLMQSAPVTLCDNMATSSVGSAIFTGRVTVVETNGNLRASTLLLTTGVTSNNLVNFKSIESSYDVSSAKPTSAIVEANSITWTNINSTFFSVNSIVSPTVPFVTTFVHVESNVGGTPISANIVVDCDLDGPIDPTVQPTSLPTATLESPYPGPATPTIIPTSSIPLPTHVAGPNDLNLPTILQP